jgi:hypothetical protein
MSKAKHNAFRRVLNKEYIEMCGVKITLVTWCIVNKENSRSIYSDHIGITSYAGSVKHQGISAYMPRQPVRVAAVDLNSNKAESARQAYYNSLEDSKRLGTIVWFNNNRGVGYVRDDETKYLFPVWSCNIKNANSPYPELVTNVSLKDKDRVSFTLGDYYTTVNCGAIKVERVNV